MIKPRTRMRIREGENERESFLIDRISLKDEVCEVRELMRPLVSRLLRLFREYRQCVNGGGKPGGITRRINVCMSEARQVVHHYMAERVLSEGKGMEILKVLDGYHKTHIAPEEARRLRLDVKHSGGIEHTVNIVELQIPAQRGVPINERQG